MSKIIIGIDVGYGNTKVVFGRSSAAPSGWNELVFKSIAIPVVVDENDSFGGGSIDRVTVILNGEHFHAGPAATFGNKDRSLDPDNIESKQHEVLIRAAISLVMREMGITFKQIDLLVLGLPVSSFFNKRDKLKQIGAQTRSVPVPPRLKGVAGSSYIDVGVSAVLVVPQPHGGLRFASECLDAQNSLFGDGEVSMVIDPGYLTMDWYLSNGANPEFRLSGSYAGGVSHLLLQLGKKIGFDHGIGNLPADLIERGLKEGHITLPEKKIDMVKYREAMFRIAKNEVGVLMSRIDWKDSGARRVVLVGGGLSYFEASLRNALPTMEIVVAESPLLSNARGYFLTGQDYFKFEN